MKLTSKVLTSAKIVAVAVLLSGGLPGVAFADNPQGAAVHSPFLTRIMRMFMADTSHATRLADGSVAGRSTAGTQSDAGQALLPASAPSNTASRPAVFGPSHHGGPN